MRVFGVDRDVYSSMTGPSRSMKYREYYELSIDFRIEKIVFLIRIYLQRSPLDYLSLCSSELDELIFFELRNLINQETMKSAM